MQMLKKLERIVEAAKRQNIVISDVLSDGTVISESEAFTRKYRLKEDIDVDKEACLVISAEDKVAVATVEDVLSDSGFKTRFNGPNEVKVYMKAGYRSLDEFEKDVKAILADNNITESCKIEKHRLKEAVSTSWEAYVTVSSDDNDEVKKANDILVDAGYEVRFNGQNEVRVFIQDRDMAVDTFEDEVRSFLTDNDLTESCKIEKHEIDESVEKDGWKLVDSDGNEVEEGQTVTDFRGDETTLKGGTPPHKDGSTGRVHTDDGEYFPGVYGLKWVKEESVTEADEKEDDVPELELDDEETKTEYGTRGEAAEGIVDNIIMGDTEAAHKALDDFIDIYMSSSEDDDDNTDIEDDAEMDGEMSGLDDDSMMDVKEESEEECPTCKKPKADCECGAE